MLSNLDVHLLAAIGVAAAGVAGAWAMRARPARARRRPEAGGVLLPFVAALLVIGAGWVLSWLSDRWGHPIRRPKGIVGPLNGGANEDTSAFGPLGAVLLFAVPVIVAFAASCARRADARFVALAVSVPLFLLLLVLQSKWNEFLTRFLVVPVVLAAPLLAFLFRRRAAADRVARGRLLRRGAGRHAHASKPLERAAVALRPGAGARSRRRTRRWPGAGALERSVPAARLHRRRPRARRARVPAVRARASATTSCSCR